MNRSSFKVLRLALVCALFLSCKQSPAPVPEEPVIRRIENENLGIAIADMPEGFEVDTNDGSRLDLRRGEGLPPGKSWIEIGPVAQAGINVVEVVNGQRELFEALPGGTFSGSRELGTPDGNAAYYSRGQFDDEGGVRTEEFRITTIHPLGNRLLHIFYRYPVGDDSADRLNDLLFLMGEVEAIGIVDAVQE